MVESGVTQMAQRIPILQMRNVTFGYRSSVLLNSVSLCVHAGEMVGLLGPNGSGKTTLLRLLSGVLQQQQGEVLLQGRNLHSWGRRGAAQRIAVVPQELHMRYAFTVEHMVSLGRTPFVSSFFGVRNQQDMLIVQDALEVSGIGGLADRIFNELSGGERQRVLIAMALAQQPLVLLLDEPTSHLDIKYQIETLELVQKLNRERGVTVVAAIHDLNLAARYFSRLLLFQRGIVADAGPAEVLEPGLLSSVYGVRVQVGILRGAEHLSVQPPSGEERRSVQEEVVRPWIHVMAGGGTGELLMRALADEHLPFVAGALNIGDSDHTLALRLADAVITEQPYAPLSLAALEQVGQSLSQTSVLIICPAPIGPGNLALLQEAVLAARRGLPVILLAPTLNPTTAPAVIEASTAAKELLQRHGFMERDYTGGAGLQLFAQLLQSNALVVETVGEVLHTTRCYAPQITANSQ